VGLRVRVPSQDELGVQIPEAAAAQSAAEKAAAASWTHHDTPMGKPTWVAQVINSMLTNEEKGLIVRDVRPPMPE
jgi:hypothetical protein